MKQENKSKNIIRRGDRVKVKIVKDEAEVTNVTYTSRPPVMHRHSKGKHIDTRTGELVESKVNKTRGDDTASLRASQQNLIDLIKVNSIRHDRILLLTLTYEKPQCDFKQMAIDFKRFIERLRANYATAFGQVEYVNTTETHEKDGLHFHAILFFNDSPRPVIIANGEMRNLWGHGFVNVTRPWKGDEIWHYLTPHPSKEVTAKNEHMHKKALTLLEMPANQPLYRASRGLKRPQIFTDNYEKVKEFLSENAYTFKGEKLYPNGLKTLNGTNLYNVKEYYKKPK